MTSQGFVWQPALPRLSLSRGCTFPPGHNAERRLVIPCDTLHALESMRRDAEIIDLPYGWGEEFAMNIDSGYKVKGA